VDDEKVLIPVLLLGLGALLASGWLVTLRSRIYALTNENSVSFTPGAVGTSAIGSTPVGDVVPTSQLQTEAALPQPTAQQLGATPNGPTAGSPLAQVLGLQ
jgi:hypothetical protein